MADAQLTKEQAAMVLRKNQQNIIQKAADGKVLNPTERETLEAVANGSMLTDPRTAQELANALGIARRTVFHLRKTADAPKSNSLEEWNAFLEARAAEGEGTMDDRLPKEVALTKHRLLKAQAGKEEAIRKLREYELQAKEADLVPLNDAKAAVRRVLAPLRALLDSFPKAVAPHANPRDVAMAEQAIEEGLDKIFQMVTNELAADHHDPVEEPAQNVSVLEWAEEVSDAE
jgi:DNA-binding CsgD family transcriptional regulator